MTDMHGRVAVVTGAAGGIGSAVVHELRARGAIVSACDLSRPEDGQHNLEVDVTDESAVIAAAGAVADGVDCSGGSKGRRLPCERGRQLHHRDGVLRRRWLHGEALGMEGK